MTVALIGITQPYIGTHAERLAMSVTGLKAGYKFGESDTGICYMLDGTGAWVVDPFVEAGALRALIGTPAGASVSADIAAIEAEVQTTSLATGAGSVATLSRAGLLVRWIADICNDATNGLAAIKTAITTLLTNASSRMVTKTSTSVLTSGTLFNVTGSVQILSITGKVTTAIANTAQTVKLSAVVDALSAVDLCTALTITNFAVKSTLYIDGTFADAMLGAGVGAAASAVIPGQATPITLVCTTSGTITVTFGTSGSLTGAIVWEILWIPLNSTGSIVAA